MTNKKMIELWGDVIEIKDLILSIAISSISTMGIYFLAPPDNATKQLFYGLSGAVLGFIISASIIRPKRSISIQNDTINDEE